MLLLIMAAEVSAEYLITSQGTIGIIMANIHLISFKIFNVIFAAVIAVPPVISLNGYLPIFKRFGLL